MNRKTLSLINLISLYEIPFQFWACRNMSKQFYTGREEDVAIDYSYHLAVDVEGVRGYSSVFADFLRVPGDVVSDKNGTRYYIYEFAL